MKCPRCKKPKTITPKRKSFLTPHYALIDFKCTCGEEFTAVYTESYSDDLERPYSFLQAIRSARDLIYEMRTYKDMVDKYCKFSLFYRVCDLKTAHPSRLCDLKIESELELISVLYPSRYSPGPHSSIQRFIKIIPKMKCVYCIIESEGSYGMKNVIKFLCPNTTKSKVEKKLENIKKYF